METLDKYSLYVHQHVMLWSPARKGDVGDLYIHSNSRLQEIPVKPLLANISRTEVYYLYSIQAQILFKYQQGTKNRVLGEERAGKPSTFRTAMPRPRSQRGYKTWTRFPTSEINIWSEILPLPWHGRMDMKLLPALSIKISKGQCLFLLIRVNSEIL